MNCNNIDTDMRLFWDFELKCVNFRQINERLLLIAISDQDSQYLNSLFFFQNDIYLDWKSTNGIYS